MHERRLWMCSLQVLLGHHRPTPKYSYMFPQIRCTSTSSFEWLKRQQKDPYVKKAKFVSFRARSAFKLLEIDEKYHIFKPGQTVVDLGASPGSWCQVAVTKVNAIVPTIISASSDDSPRPRDPKLVSKDEAGFEIGYSEPADLRTNKEPKHGFVIGVDLLCIDPLPGAVFLDELDFTKPKTQQKITDLLGGRKVDVVLSDMAPNASGIHQLDHDCIIALCKMALEFSRKVLAQNGTFLCKIWSGHDQKLLMDEMKMCFSLVRNVKPPASRGDSSELYLLGTGFSNVQRTVEPGKKTATSNTNLTNKIKKTAK